MLCGHPLGPVVAQEAGGVDTVYLIGAGDIGDCRSEGDELTATLLKRILYARPGVVPDTNQVRVITLGDNAYPYGTRANFAECYGPTWGNDSIKRLTYPSVGNHEYKNVCVFGLCGILQGTATPYFDYFGARAGPRYEGWHSYAFGQWRVYVLNTGPFASVGVYLRGSEQLRWLRAELEAHPSECAVAYLHSPRFSVGKHGDNRWLEPMWRLLYDGGVDVVIAGHEHNYQRFEPQDPRGRRDPERGITQFIVGTGGTPLRGFPGHTASATLAARDSTSFGVLKLALAPEGYEWEFLAAPEGAVRDAGVERCRR